MYPSHMATLAKAPTKSTYRMSHAELEETAAYLGVDPTGLDTEVLRAEVKRVGEARWKEENREAIEQWNAWLRENGDVLSELAPQ